MKVRVLCVVGVVGVACALSLYAADPVVSNVRASQRVGTKLVDILYDVADADSATVAVSLRISNDGGDTWTVPAASLSGNGIGASVTPGANKSIVWDAGADWNGQWSDRMRVEVTAADAAPEGFVLIHAGTNSGTDPDFGAYSLTVSTFYMSKYETTKAIWDEVRAWGMIHGYTDLPVGDGKGPMHPVHSVSWYDAVKWCNAWSEKEGRTPCYTVSSGVYQAGEPGGVSDISCNTSANGYRLPTDTEWEYAARGGISGKRFPWSTDTITHNRANYYSFSSYSYDISTTRGFHPTYNDGTDPYTSPVGSFESGKNAYGLYDMSGNVWEWCWDWYPGLEGSNRVRRGGGWCYDADPCRAGSRGGGTPDHRYRYIGFRACSAVQ